MTVQPVAPARRDRGTQILFIVAALVAVGGLAFAVGRITAPPPVSAAANGRGFGNFNRGAEASGAPGFGGGFGGGLGRGLAAGGGVTVRGTVQSVSPTALTIKLADGSTATVDLTGTTTYHKQAAATSSDVTAGGQVEVQVQFQPRASGAPGASPAPSGAPRTFTASDVTLVGP